jgi:hypothetical protein
MNEISRSSTVLDRELEDEKTLNPSSPRLRCPQCGSPVLKYQAIIEEYAKQIDAKPTSCGDGCVQCRISRENDRLGTTGRIEKPW